MLLNYHKLVILFFDNFINVTNVMPMVMKMSICDQKKIIFCGKKVYKKIYLIGDDIYASSINIPT